MRGAIIENGIVTNTIAIDGVTIGQIGTLGEGDDAITYVVCDDAVGIGWSHGGETFTPPPQPEPEPPTEDGYRLAIQSILDAAAKSRRYESGSTLAGYVTSTNPQWAAEAQAFVAWRDAVWAYAYAEMEKVLTGQRPQPTIEAFLAELEPITWPS